MKHIKRRLFSIKDRLDQNIINDIIINTFTHRYDDRRLANKTIVIQDPHEIHTCYKARNVFSAKLGIEGEC